MPSFSSTPNEFVTSAGVALLSLAHQLSAYSHDSNMATALAAASKVEYVGMFLYFYLDFHQVFVYFLHCIPIFALTHA